MKEMSLRHLKTTLKKTKQNKTKNTYNTKRHLLQNDQNADKTLMHSHEGETGSYWWLTTGKNEKEDSLHAPVIEFIG